MKTRKDAERVVELSSQREKLHKLAAEIRMADNIAAAGLPAADHRYMSRAPEPETFAVVHLADELRELVKREAAVQIEAIEQDLKALGVAPDEFEAAAPDSGAVPVTIVAVRRAG